MWLIPNWGYLHRNNDSLKAHSPSSLAKNPEIINCL